MHTAILKWTVFLVSLSLFGCGGGGGYGGGNNGGGNNGGGNGGGGGGITYTVGGTITGLTGSVTLQDDRGNTVTPTGNTFTFPPLANGASYEIGVKQQPDKQTCTIKNGTGKIDGSNVTDVTVTCVTNPPSEPGHFTVGGTITGHTGPVTLQNNGANDITTEDNVFTFPAQEDGTGYDVKVTQHPADQTCTVSNGADTIAGSNVTNVTVECVTNPPDEPGHFTVGGTITGHTGSVTLQNNAANDLTTDENAFTFPAQVDGSGYKVTVKQPPDNQSCTVADGEGTLAGSNVDKVKVTCTTNPPSTHTLSVNVTGLNGSNVVVRNGSGANVTLSNGSTALGSFVSGTSFDISIVQQPSFPAANCTFSNTTTRIDGVIGDTDSIVEAACTALPTIDTLATDVTVFQTRTVTLTWPDPGNTRQFNLFVSTDPNCDLPTCGEPHPGVASGLKFDKFGGQTLKHGQPYFFQLEVVYNNGPDGVSSRGLSNKTSALPNAVAFDGPVNAIALASGTVPHGSAAFLGGAFHNAGVTSGSLVALDTRTGSRAGVNLPIVAGTVNAILADGNGGWYIGGEFTHVGAVPRRNLAHIDAKGGVDPDFSWAPDAPVHALAHASRGAPLFIGGRFQSISSATGVSALRPYVAAVSADGGSLLNWSPSPSAPLTALAVLDGRLYAGGLFDSNGGMPKHFAAFQLDDAGAPRGVTALPLDMSLDAPVQALTVHGHDLYVGGRFTTFGNQPRNHAAKLSMRSGALQLSADFNPDPHQDAGTAAVNAIAVSNDGSTVHLGGTFQSVKGGARRNFAAVSANKGEALAADFAPSFDVLSMAVAPDDTLYVGGVSTLAAVTTKGTVFFAAPSGKAGAGVRAVAVSGRTLLAGGDFNSLGSVPRETLASLNSQGSLTQFDSATDGVVNALVFHRNPSFGPTPLLYVGGSFNTLGAEPSPNLGAISTLSGHLPAAPVFTGTADGPVNALSLHEPTNGLYVGGQFARLAGETINPTTGRPTRNLGKLFLNNGTIDLGFTPGPNGAVRAVTAVTETIGGAPVDVVYAGGDFTALAIGSQPDAIPRSRFVKLKAATGTAFTFDEFFFNPNSFVTSIALGGVAVYVGGHFTNIATKNGTVSDAPRLAAIAADGSQVLTAFAPRPTGGDPLVLTFLNNQQAVLTGGNFQSIGNQPFADFAFLHGTGPGETQPGTAFPNVIFPNGLVGAVKVSSDGDIYIGGSFTSIGGVARGNLAVIDQFTGQLVQ